MSTPAMSDQKRRGAGSASAFQACVDAIRASAPNAGESAPIRPTTADKLRLYGLFKQATLGDNTVAAPWVWQLTERAKWQAWTSRAGMSERDAKSAYVAAVAALLPSPSDAAGKLDKHSAAAIERLRQQIASSKSS
jgi:diazepam-binding inhibitor (GABA receptor modulator, acyl-CoA-binding protein)